MFYNHNLSIYDVPHIPSLHGNSASNKIGEPSMNIAPLAFLVGSCWYRSSSVELSAL